VARRIIEVNDNVANQQATGVAKARRRKLGGDSWLKAAESARRNMKVARKLTPAAVAYNMQCSSKSPSKKPENVAMAGWLFGGSRKC